MAKAVQEIKNQLPTDTSYEDQYAGEGTFTEEKYTITPRVSILQALSPQVKKQNVAYVEGAAPGMIYLDTYHSPLISGDDGIYFQPCWFETRWEVRTPRETGGAANWMGEFNEPQPGWREHKAEKGGYTYYETEDGNIANEIHVHAGLVHLDGARLPYAIKFAGTGVFISRRWNGQISGRLTAKGEPAARFGFLYKMKVRTQSNNIGEWGQWNISPGGVATAEDMRVAHEFRKALKERRTVIEQEEEPIDITPQRREEGEKM